MIGSRVGPYEITAKLGEGGMGDNDADAVREMYSTSACLLNIGTDPDEW